MKKRIAIWVVIVLLAVTGSGFGYSAYQRNFSDQEPVIESDATGETAVARVGDLTIYASGSGQVIPGAETALSFDESGVLVEILVSVGDEVTAGDVLARLRTEKTATQLAADVASAELAVIEAQQALEGLYESAQMNAAEALVNLESTQKDLEELLDYDLERAQAMQAIATARQTIEDTEMTLYIYNSVPSDDAIYTVYASLLFVEKEYNELKERVEDIEFEIKSAPNKMIRDRFKSQLIRVRTQLLNKQIEYENALYRYNNLLAPPDPLDVALAESQVTTAQAELKQADQDLLEAQAGPPPGEIAMAKAQLGLAQAEWDRLKDGPDPEDVTLAETRLSNAELELSILQQEQLIIDLVAPVSGTVMAVDAAVGEQITGEAIINLADVSQPLVEVYLDEADYGKIQIGYPVEVIFDAFPESTFTGRVIGLDPGLVSIQGGAQAIRAVALLDEASYAKPIPLPVGLHASVDVIAGQTEEAVLVPIEAIHKVDEAENIVYVLNNDEFEIRQVEVGITDFTSAEIVSGLSSGEVVAVGHIEK